MDPYWFFLGGSFSGWWVRCLGWLVWRGVCLLVLRFYYYGMEGNGKKRKRKRVAGGFDCGWVMSLTWQRLDGIESGRGRKSTITDWLIDWSIGLIHQRGRSVGRLVGRFRLKQPFPPSLSLSLFPSLPPSIYLPIKDKTPQEFLRSHFFQHWTNYPILSSCRWMGFFLPDVPSFPLTPFQVPLISHTHQPDCTARRISRDFEKTFSFFS